MSATTRVEQLQEAIFDDGRPDMLRALACNPYLSETLRERLYIGEDAQLRALAVAMTANSGLIADAAASPDERIAAAAVSNQRADEDFIEKASAKGVSRACLSWSAPEENRRKHWTADRAVTFINQGARGSGHPARCGYAARALAMAFCAPWLEGTIRTGNLRSAFDIYRAVRRRGLLDMNILELESAVTSSPRTDTARLVLALRSPSSGALMYTYLADRIKGKHRWPEPYALALAVSAQGGVLANPYSSYPREDNPTSFVSPVCEVDTHWDTAMYKVARQFAEPLTLNHRLVSTICSLAEDWEGTLEELVEASLTFCK